MKTECPFWGAQRSQNAFATRHCQLDLTLGTSPEWWPSPVTESLAERSVIVLDHVGHSQAAPRTPLESPCLGGTSWVSTWSEKTYLPHSPGTSR